MESAESRWAALLPHASTLGGATCAIDAHARLLGSGSGLFRYVLRADIARVRIPPTQTVERADGLWQHTCFEAFLRVPGAPGYYEINIAPSRQWAVYRFDAYRQGMSSPEVQPPEISVRRFAARLEVDAAVRLRDLNGLQGAPRLQVALSAVLEAENGTLSHWALKHASSTADFHHPDGFVLELTV